MRVFADLLALTLSLAALIYGLLNWQGDHGRIDGMAILVAIIGLVVLKSVLFSLWWRRRKTANNTDACANRERAPHP